MFATKILRKKKQGKRMARQRKQKVVLPPALPPEMSEDEIEVSDEDLQFLQENQDYAGFVSCLDTHSITEHVSRVAGLKEDTLEASYEKRLGKKSRQNEREEEENGQLQVDPVDALPVKTLDGRLYYRTCKSHFSLCFFFGFALFVLGVLVFLFFFSPEEHEILRLYPGLLLVCLFNKAVKESKNHKDEDATGDGEKDSGADKSIVRLTKAEKRAKLKRSKKEAKKLKDLGGTDEVEKTPQAAVLAEVKEELSVEEAFESKKLKLAELGMSLLEDPESNIKLLKEMLQSCKDGDPTIVKLGLLSLLAVFKDIIPGYRIRLPTEKELEMKVSNDVKKMRYYESTLLSVYKAYLQKLITLEKQSKFQHVAVRCICTLLESVPHFNFRENLLDAVVVNTGSPDDVIRKLCCSTVKSLFTNEAKHGSEATLEAVRLIADNVKAHNCQLHPDSVEVFMSLSFDEDLGKSEGDKDNKVKNKNNKKRKNAEKQSRLHANDQRKSRQELLTKMREEVAADYKAASFTLDVKEQKRMQSETLSAVFETYFRILKHTMQSIMARSEADDSLVGSTSGAYPLLAPCLDGLGRFSHLIDLDYIGDLMNYLKKLAGGDVHSDDLPEKCFRPLTVSERLQCCIVAFKVMRSNLDALNVDLQDFFVQLYNIILEYRPGRDKGEVLAEALRIMLCEDRQHDMQKAAAFVKRLATFSLCFGSAESMAALVTLKHLLQKNVKCRNLLENDAGGGSVSGSIAKYQPYAYDPNLSGALASVLWELNLLSKHYHPAVSVMASGISSMGNPQNQVILPTLSPQQAFTDFALDREACKPRVDTKKENNKRKRGSGSSKLRIIEHTIDAAKSADEDELQKKLSDHFLLLSDIKENEKWRVELDRTTLALQLYEEYKQLKKRRGKV